MKECSYCGKIFSDNVTVCDVDGQPAIAVGSKSRKTKARGFSNSFTGRAAPMKARALVGSVGLGMIVPAMQVKNASGSYAWIFLGLIIAMGCYLCVSFVISKLIVKLKPQTFFGKQSLLFGYWIAPILTYLTVFWIVKSSN